MKNLLLYLLVAVTATQSSAQYFGRNKPRYQELDFKVENTPNFTMYHHLQDPAKVQQLAEWTEQWYSMHQAILCDTFKDRNPIIFYNDHSGFQQTNTIQGDISVGTGGVTEGLRNRVVLPIAPTNQQTHHVLGHELVHAFQYHMVINGDSTSLGNLQNVPLWMVEGLAEYMSIGRVDAHTALWMRDAIKHNYLPTVRDLNNMGKYFPYRWGQAFWAYVAGTYTEKVIPELYMTTARFGLDVALALVLETDQKTLSEQWQKALKEQYASAVQPKAKENPPGNKLFGDKNQGRMTVSPSVSPNGKYVVFLTEKNLFTTDLYLADAKTGQVIRRISSTSTDGHIDQMNFIESSGTWSPDSKQYAFDVYEKGRSMLIIKNIDKARTVRKIRLDSVPSFSNPAWSPDGKRIVVTGLVQGQVDLWSVDLKTLKVERLTNDIYSEHLPTWSEDGKLLAYSTDRLSMQRGRTDGKWKMNLAVMDYMSGRVEDIDVFPGADNMNPQFGHQGDLYFLSDRDGKRNMYKYKLDEKKVYQMTDLITGITGITFYAPAISVSEDRNRIVYTHYDEGAYVIYTARDESFLNREVTDTRTVDKQLATLPPATATDLVNTQINALDRDAKRYSGVKSERIPYRPHFVLEYLGGSAGIGGGVATGNSSFGNATSMAGGIDMLFGDILGNNQLYSGLSISGDILDAAGQFAYINQKRRINWGANLSHIPYQSGSFRQDQTLGVLTNLDGDTLVDAGGTPIIGYRDEAYLERVFQEQLNVFAFYPLSITQRLEIGGAGQFYHNRRDLYIYYTDQFEQNIGQERQKLGKAPGFGLSNLNAAYVGDNSYFGFTAPLAGWRYRIGTEQFFGRYRFNALLLDGRRYFKMRHATFAVRSLNYLRMGGNANNTNEVFPSFAAQSFFVRGYTQRVLEQAPELIPQMTGSKLIVGNAELRIPFFGVRPVSLINFGILPTDINLFFDAGLGFFRLDDLKSTALIRHKPFYSTGISFRVNVFNAIIVEPFYSWALRLPEGVEKRGRWGFNIVPGW